MKITISRGDTDRPPGLRVIGEVPDYPLCLLEGRNGIGKTVAARLLELATGSQPYAAMPSAWATLRGQLGPTTITVSPLPDGGRLEYRLDPDAWPDDPVAPGEWLGEVTLDGASVSFADACTRFRATRIAGDETLVQTLARELEERSVVAAALASKRVRPNATAWEEALSSLTSELAGISRSALLEASSLARTASDASANAQVNAESAMGVAAAAASAAVLASALAIRRRDLPPLLTALTESARGIEQARTRLQQAHMGAQQAAIDVEASKTVREALAQWERLLGLRRRALDREQSKERQLLHALSLGERPDPLQLARLTMEANDRRAAMLQRQGMLDLIKPRRELARRIEEPLAAAAPHLGQEVIAQTRHAITVDQLLDGVRRVVADLDSRPRPDELVDLDQAVAEADGRLRLLRALTAQVELTSRKAARVAEAEQKRQALFAQVNAPGRAALEQAETAVRDAIDDVLDADRAAGEVRKQIGELLGLPPAAPSVAVEAAAARPDEHDDEDSEDTEAVTDALYPGLDFGTTVTEATARDASVSDALQRLDLAALAKLAQMADLDLDPLFMAVTRAPTEPVGERFDSALRSLHEASAAASSHARLLVTVAEHESRIAATASERLTVLRHGAHNAHARLTAVESRWGDPVRVLLEAAGAPTDTPPEIPAGAELSESELAVADALAAVTAITRAQAAAALGLASTLEALSGYLATTAARIAPRGRDHASHPEHFRRGLGDRIDAWTERVLADELIAPDLLEQLFDGAESVRVHMTDLTVTWRPPFGALRRRPLEAFSSGEQVFAYTRANLARLARGRRPGQATIVFLDEFGAFVARDRLGQLMDFVEHEALGRVADQVVVMLPLSRDYSAAGGIEANAADEIADSIGERARQLAALSYFAVPFTVDRAHAS